MRIQRYCVTTLESTVAGVSAFHELVVTVVTVLCKLVVIDVTNFSILVVVGIVATSEPPTSPLDGS